MDLTETVFKSFLGIELYMFWWDIWWS